MAGRADTSGMISLQGDRGGIGPIHRGLWYCCAMKSMASALAVLLAVTIGSAKQTGTNPAKDTKLTVAGKAEGMLGRGHVSPDGKYISFEDQLLVEAGGTGNLAIWDTQTGETRIVNRFSNALPWAEGFAEASIWSPDATALAYSWAAEGRPTNRELRIVDVKSGEHRAVFRTSDGETRLVPFRFTADGRALLVAIGTRAGEGTIAAGELTMIVISDGTRRTLKTFEGHIPLNASLSPDGEEVAFDFEPKPGSGGRDIAVVSLSSRSQRVLGVAPASHKVLLGWLPDGHLLFTTNVAGRTDAWILKSAAAGPQPAAVLVRRDVGQLEPLGVTSDGRVFVQKVTSVGEIYVAELDAGSGKARQAATPLPGAQPGLLRSEPAWSPNGLRIAHVQRTTGTAAKVVVQTIATGESSVYEVPVRNMDWMVWARDGESLFFDGTDTRDNVQRMSRLDLATGAVEAASDPRRFIIGFSPDDRYLFEVGAGRGLSRRDRTTGATEALGAGAPAIALSPDTRWIAYLQNGPPGQRTLAVRPVTGGGPERILLEKLAPGYPRLTWTSDSRYIIFNVQQEGLHRISVQGGAKEPLNVGRGLGWITEKSMNVNGRQLAFAVTGTQREVWVWSDIVPGPQPRRN